MRFKLFDNLINSYTRNFEYRDLLNRIEELENSVRNLQQENAILIKEFYRLENSLDERIDILTEKWGNQNDLFQFE